MWNIYFPLTIVIPSKIKNKNTSFLEQKRCYLIAWSNTRKMLHSVSVHADLGLIRRMLLLMQIMWHFFYCLTISFNKWRSFLSFLINWNPQQLYYNFYFVSYRTWRTSKSPVLSCFVRRPEIVQTFQEFIVEEHEHTSLPSQCSFLLKLEARKYKNVNYKVFSDFSSVCSILDISLPLKVEKIP